MKKVVVRYNGEKPTRGSGESAGYDVVSKDDVFLKPHQVGKVTTPTKLQPIQDYFYTAVPRSSLCNKNGLILLNSVGIIDKDYTGNMIWNFWNLSNEPVTIKAGERIGQIVFHEMVEAQFVKEEFKETERGENGFGSSGKF